MMPAPKTTNSVIIRMAARTLVTKAMNDMCDTLRYEYSHHHTSALSNIIYLKYIFKVLGPRLLHLHLHH